MMKMKVRDSKVALEEKSMQGFLRVEQSSDESFLGCESTLSEIG